MTRGVIEIWGWGWAQSRTRWTIRGGYNRSKGNLSHANKTAKVRHERANETNYTTLKRELSEGKITLGWWIGGELNVSMEPGSRIRDLIGLYGIGLVLDRFY